MSRRGWQCLAGRTVLTTAFAFRRPVTLYSTRSLRAANCVCGCLSPSVFLIACSASSSNGLASPSLPMAFSSAPMLLIETNVLAWRSPRVSLCACTTSSYSGLASSSWPIVFSRLPSLPIETSVSGWRSPSVSLCACSASSCSGLAPPSLPMAFSSTPMLPIETSVSGWRLPSVSLCACSASLHSGLASPSWPMSISSVPRLLIEANVLRWRLPSVSLFACSASSSSGLASFSWPISFSSTPMLLIECLLEQRSRLLSLAHGLQHIAHVVDRSQRAQVAVAQRLPAHLQRLLEQRPRLLQLAHLIQQQAQPPQRLSDQRLAQQAADQRVALDEAHALLQFVQNGLGILGVAALGFAHVHLGQARQDRLEVRAEAQRRFEGGLLRRGHHHIELRAALLCVVDLLDAVGALERCGRVPRLHQQHRVPDGAYALAEPRQVGLHVGLPDHVVAHPEERVLLPQPLLLEEVSERVEQRVDRRVEEPAHEHGGLAHVRRAPRLQPLAHGQLVHLFPAGDEVLVGVAVDRPAVEVLVCGYLGVDLLHRVARQL
eukprot:scaffold19200_cov60-Phaeocystis_antarctica.AAC.4